MSVSDVGLQITTTEVSSPASIVPIPKMRNKSLPIVKGESQHSKISEHSVNFNCIPASSNSAEENIAKTSLFYSNHFIIL